jgi:transcriptional regulator with XRE-family HTH domain
MRGLRRSLHHGGNNRNQRRATLSDIENGKSEIGVLTLVHFAIELNKPISYFFPESLLKNIIVDVNSPFQHKILEIARGIEYFGDQSLTLDILKVLSDHFENENEAMMNGYPPETSLGS